MKRSHILLHLCATGLIAAIAYIAVVEAPTLWAPAPLLFLVPAMWLGTFRSLGHDGIGWVPVLAAFTYVLFSIPLLKRPERLPITTVVLYALSILGSVLFFGFMWFEGVTNWGAAWVIALATLNVFAIACLALMLRSSRRSGNPLALLSFHIGVFLWLSWGAFPWLFAPL